MRLFTLLVVLVAGITGCERPLPSSKSKPAKASKPQEQAKAKAQEPARKELDPGEVRFPPSAVRPRGAVGDIIPDDAPATGQAAPARKAPADTGIDAEVRDLLARPWWKGMIAEAAVRAIIEELTKHGAGMVVFDRAGTFRYYGLGEIQITPIAFELVYSEMKSRGLLKPFTGDVKLANIPVQSGGGRLSRIRAARLLQDFMDLPSGLEYQQASQKTWDEFRHMRLPNIPGQNIPRIPER